MLQDREELVLQCVLIAQCTLEYHLMEDNVSDVYKVKLFHQWVFAVNAHQDHGLLMEEHAEDKLNQIAHHHVVDAIKCFPNVDHAAVKDVAER